MVIMKKSLSRRTVLRGIGAAIGLPLLDGMVPAFAAAPAPVKRFGAVYCPNGMSMPFWTPKGEGNLELSPIMAPLTSVRDRVLVLSGMANKDAYPLLNEGDGDHSRERPSSRARMHTRRPAGTRRSTASRWIKSWRASREGETQLASLELSSSPAAGGPVRGRLRVRVRRDDRLARRRRHAHGGQPARGLPTPLRRRRQRRARSAAPPPSDRPQSSRLDRRARRAATDARSRRS